MAEILDCGYLSTPTGQLNLAEIICLIGALISVGFTSRLYCELVDNLQWIYPELNTLYIRAIFQSFAVVCLTVTIIILITNIFALSFWGKNSFYINQLSLVFNIIMGLMMISIGICAAFWEDKLRRTPRIIRRGYFLNNYQYLFGELTHPRPGAAAASAIFAILTGILFIIEACTRPMLNTEEKIHPTHYTSRIITLEGERIIPIEIIRSSYRPTRV